MNIYFIHGVNKRRELGDAFAGVAQSGHADDGFRKKYEKELEQLERDLTVCASQAGFSSMRLIPIYWGNLGVRFHYYKQKSEAPPRYEPLVQSGPAELNVQWARRYQSQGLGSSPVVDPQLQFLSARLDRIAEASNQGGCTLADLLLASPQAVLDALLAPELESTAVSPQTRARVRSAAAVLCDRLRDDQELRSEILALKSDDDADVLLVERIEAELSSSTASRSLGIAGWALKNARRLAIRPIVGALQSPRAYVDVGRFIGDSVRYFAGRGTDERPGPVVEAVVRQLYDGGWPERGSGPNVFITHSLGGAVFYDLFSYFQPNLHFDLWVSVGSQLAYYEDAKLLAHQAVPSSASSGPGRAKVRAPLPDGARWYNVFDSQDWLAFHAQVVFENVHDRAHTFPVMENFTSVHTAYFRHPNFFQLFTTILRETFNSRDEVDWLRFFEAMSERGIDED